MKYFEHQDLVDEPEVLIVPMTAYDLVLGLPWFQTKNADIDWEAGRLLSLRADRQLGASVSGPDIQTLSATAFGDFCDSDEVADAFCLTLGECKGLLGATFGSHRKDGERVTLGAGRARRSSGSSCGRRTQTRLE